MIFISVKVEWQVNTASLLEQPRQNCNETIEQPSVRTIRNRGEWKSYNYGIKETTSIQTDRGDRDGEQALPTSICGE